ncbi:MAG: GNAT family N-acetyltransferase [Solirubrobacteraceae bacterium]|nr:GNAT family N-acetyltransferase [Solirubrobacteraceae bacterium]MCU0313458.1 GNAT family N-acetyltransferase [Solirubrobacteraceae bacterium]
MSRPAIPVPDPPLQDGVIALRPWSEADVPALVASCSDEQTLRFTSVPTPYTPEDARLFVGAGHTEAALPLAVVEAGDPAAVLGAVGLHAVDRSRGRGEIGYWTSPWARRRGIATRSLTLLSGWALDRSGLGLVRLELYAEPVNLASQEVARLAGYVQGDLVRGGIALRGRRRDVLRFVLTRT